MTGRRRDTHEDKDSESHSVRISQDVDVKSCSHKCGKQSYM